MGRITMPQAGQTMEQGTIVRWMLELNSPMTVGAELYEIETEKTIVPIEATRQGRIVRFVAQPGDTVAVGALLAIAAEPDEAVTEVQVDALLAQPQDSVPIDPVETSGSLASGAAVQRALRETKVPVSPRARTLATELGVRLFDVAGSGPHGTIVPDDIRRAAKATPTLPAEHSSGARSTPLMPITRTMIASLEKAWQTPQFTQGILVDATALVAARQSADDLSYMDFFLDAMVRAARAVPEVLARIVGANLELRDSIDITVATATDHGLLVPVLRDAGALDLLHRRDVWRALVARARDRKLGADEATGGILALSNLGTRGVDYGTPLLPVGHSLIVFVGSLEPRPIVIDQRLEARPSLHVAITYDHRVVDGVLGSRYTSALKSALLAP